MLAGMSSSHVRKAVNVSSTTAVVTCAGIVCSSDGFGCTIVTLDDIEDHDIAIPASIRHRGEGLWWLTQEAERLFRSLGVGVVRLQKAGSGKFGAAPERHEVEACVKVGAHLAQADLLDLNREQVRAALGVPKAKGAYEGLLRRPDVMARRNASRRDQYLLALTASA